MTARLPVAILAILLVVAGCGRLGPPVRAARVRAAEPAASSPSPATDDAEEDEEKP